MEQGLLFESESAPMKGTCDAQIDQAIESLARRGSPVNTMQVHWLLNAQHVLVPVSQIPARLSRAVRLGILRRRGTAFCPA